MGKEQFYVPSTIQSVPSKQLKFVEEFYTDELVAGDSESHYFYSDPNEFSKVVSLEMIFKDITEATSGEKRINVYTSNGTLDELNVKGDYNLRVGVEANGFKNPNTSRPVETALPTIIKGGMHFTSDVPLLVKFFNQSDANTTAQRSILMVAESEVVKN